MYTSIFFSCLPRTGLDRSNYHLESASQNKLTPWPGDSAKDLPPRTSLHQNQPDQSAPAQGNILAQELLRAHEQERQKLASELHDQLGQSLILLKNQVLKIKNNPVDKAEPDAHLNNLTNLITASLQQVREISYGLRPYELDLLGLRQALLSLAEATATSAAWSLMVDLPDLNQLFAKKHEIYIYRIIEECFRIIQNQPAVTEVRFLAYTRPTATIWEIHVSGPATFFSFLATNFLKNFALCRLQEYLNIVAGQITFMASNPRRTIMQINVPFSSDNPHHEKTESNNCR